MQHLVLTEGLNGKPLRFLLHLWYAPQLLQKGSPVNRAIFRITSGAAEKPLVRPRRRTKIQRFSAVRLLRCWLNRPSYSICILPRLQTTRRLSALT